MRCLAPIAAPDEPIHLISNADFQTKPAPYLLIGIVTNPLVTQVMSEGGAIEYHGQIREDFPIFYVAHKANAAVNDSSSAPSWNRPARAEPVPAH
jgi:hypothetical protein